MNAIGAAGRLAQVAPHFFGGERQQGREQPNQRVHDSIENRLGGSARVGLGASGIEAILGDVHPNGAQIGGSEVVNRAIDFVECIFVIPGAAFRN